MLFRSEIADNFNNQIDKVEMYKNNRCIAMTGNSVAGTSNNIIDKQSEIDIYYECFAPKKSIREQIRAYQSDNDTLPIASIKRSFSNLLQKKVRGLPLENTPRCRSVRRFTVRSLSADYHRHDFFRTAEAWVLSER